MTSRRTFIVALAAAAVAGPALAQQATLVTVYLNPT
jgi:hypothetical protein